MIRPKKPQPSENLRALVVKLITGVNGQFTAAEKAMIMTVTGKVGSQCVGDLLCVMVQLFPV